MQRVIHEYRNLSPIFMLLEELYTYLSDYDEHFDDVIWLPTCFMQVCRILQEYLFNFQSPKIKRMHFPPVKYDEGKDNEIVVCLSGGKDSAATAYYYKQKGYTVHLYHATGVNKAYGDEKLAAQKIADYLGCDLFIDRIQLPGTHKFIEHPLKNYVIANGAIHYAINMHYAPRIAFGNFSKSKLIDNPFQVCAGDCRELWQAYSKIVKTVIPGFRIELPLNTNADTFKLLSNDWQLFSLCVSCMSPFRFREHWKHRTEQRYNVKLFDNRCGCCWKDCMEAMWLMDFGKMEYNEEFYHHCFDILGRTILKETGSPAESTTAVWNNYMFYPLSKSKAKKWIRTSKPYSNRGGIVNGTIHTGYDTDTF